MGLFDLFLPPRIQTAPDIPQISTALTQTAIGDILSGKMQAIPVKRIVLHNNEDCFFCDHAILIEEKLQVVGHKRNGNGFTFRVMKGMYYRINDGGNVAIRDTVREYTRGKLYITNERVVFSADSKAFHRKISDLITYRVEEGTLILQFGKGSYRLILPVVQCAEKVLEYVL